MTTYKATTDPNALSAEALAEKVAKAEAVSRARAERFGVEYKPPHVNNILDPTERKIYQTYLRSGAVEREDGATKATPAAAEAGEEGIATGFDIFSPEELAKKEARAARFNLLAGTDPSSTGGENQEKSETGGDAGSGSGSGLVAGAVDEQAMAQAAADAELLAKSKARAARFNLPWGANVGEDGKSIAAREPRVEPGPEVERIFWKLYLFGCDNLENHHIKGQFANIGVKFVEWVHDSTALVHFYDEASAKRAFLALELREGEDGTEQEVMAGQWRRADVLGPREAVFVLDVRYATVEDVKEEDAWKRSVWKKQQNRKRGRGNNQQGGRAKRAR